MKIMTATTYWVLTLFLVFFWAFHRSSINPPKSILQSVLFFFILKSLWIHMGGKSWISWWHIFIRDLERIPLLFSLFILFPFVSFHFCYCLYHCVPFAIIFVNVYPLLLFLLLCILCNYFYYLVSFAIILTILCLLLLDLLLHSLLLSWNSQIIKLAI